MIQKNSRTFLLGISCTVTLIGLLVIIGWFTGNEFLIRIHPDLTSMKFVAAVLFFLCGFQLLFLVKMFIDHMDKYYKWLVILSTFSICIILLCAALVISPSVGHIVDLLPKEKQYDLWTRIPYMPSLLGLAVLLIISVTHLLLISWYERTIKLSKYIGIMLVVIGILALIGNIFRINSLFFATEFSGGVSVHTGILTCLIGVYFYILSSHLVLKQK